MRDYFPGKNEYCLSHDLEGFGPLWTIPRQFQVTTTIHTSDYKYCSVSGHWISDPDDAVDLSASPGIFWEVLKVANPVWLQAGPDHICSVGNADLDIGAPARGLLEELSKRPYDESALRRIPDLDPLSEPALCDHATTMRTGYLLDTCRIVQWQGLIKPERCLLEVMANPVRYREDAVAQFFSAPVAICRRFEALDPSAFANNQSINLAIIPRRRSDHACHIKQFHDDEK